MPSYATPSYASPSGSTPSGTVIESTPQPVLEPDEGTSSRNTFRRQNENSNDTNPTGFEPPQLVDPRDRTVDQSTPKVRTAVYRRPAAKKTPASRDTEGWHSVPRDR